MILYYFSIFHSNILILRKGQFNLDFQEIIFRIIFEPNYRYLILCQSLSIKAFPKFNLSHFNNQMMKQRQSINHKYINNSQSVPLKNTRRNSLMRSFSSISKITLPQPFEPLPLPYQSPSQVNGCKMNVKQLFEQVRKHFKFFNQKRKSVKETKEVRIHQKQRENNKKDDIRIFLNCKSALRKNNEREDVTLPLITQTQPYEKIIAKEMLQIIKTSKLNSLKSNSISLCDKNLKISFSKEQRHSSNDSFQGIHGSPLARSKAKQLLKNQNGQRRIKTEMNEDQLKQNYKRIKMKNNFKGVLCPLTIDLSLELPIRISLGKNPHSSSHPH